VGLQADTTYGKSSVRPSVRLSVRLSVSDDEVAYDVIVFLFTSSDTFAAGCIV